MSRGKHLSLDEARKSGKLDQFADEHPAEGDQSRFGRLLKAMASGKKPAKSGTSNPAASEGSNGTQSPRGTSEDA